MNAFQVLNHFSENPFSESPSGGLFLLCGFQTFRITAFSQQNRAVSLVEALVAAGQLREGTTIGVIGGGVAGCTAAYWAACHGAAVTIYEEAPDILQMYRNAHHRFLHPSLFNWPRKGWDRKETNLPCLNWEFGTGKDIEAAWRQRVAPLISPANVPKPYAILPYNNCQQLSLAREGKRWRVTTAGHRELLHEILVVAVGTGRDGRLLSNQIVLAESHGYWEEPEAWKPGAIGPVLWMIGSGDGALMDLLRYKLRDVDEQGRRVEFDERGLLRLLNEWKTKAPASYDSVVEAILQNEPFGRIESEDRAYEDIFRGAVDRHESPCWISNWFDTHLEREPQVTLYSDRKFLQRGASPLMRFLGFQLVEADRRQKVYTIVLRPEEKFPGPSSIPDGARILVRAGSDRPLDRLLACAAGGKPLSVLAQERSAAQQFDFFIGHFGFPAGFNDRSGNRGLEQANPDPSSSSAVAPVGIEAYKEALRRVAQNVQVPLLSTYRRSVQDGFSADLLLLSAYVDLDVRLQESAEIRPGRRVHGPDQPEDEEMAGPQAERKPLLDVLDELSAQTPGLWLLGEGGRGKSTVLNFVALVLADPELEAADLPEDVRGSVRRIRSVFEARFPVLIRLRDLVGVAIGDTPDFEWMIRHSVHALIAGGVTKRLKGQSRPSLEMLARTVPESIEKLVTQALQGSCVLLVDGLDEMPDDQRGVYVRALKAFVARCPERDFRILLTTRPAAIQDECWPDLLPWPGATLLPLSATQRDDGSPSQQEVFAEKYFRLMGVADAGASARELLTKAGRVGLAGDDPSALSREPLLLASLVHLACRKSGGLTGGLPGSRAETLHAVLKLMLEEWDQVHHVPVRLQLLRTLDQHGLTLDDCAQSLRKLAFEALIESRSTIARTALEDSLHYGFRRGSFRSAGDRRSFAVETARILLERLGFLRAKDSEGNQFEFSALMFRDFLAGVYVAKNSAQLISLLPAGATAGQSGREHSEDAAALGVSARLHGLDQPAVPAAVRFWDRAWEAMGPLLKPGGAALDARLAMSCAILEEICPISRWDQGQSPAKEFNAPKPWTAQAQAGMFHRGAPIGERVLQGRILGYMGDPRPGVGVVPVEGLTHGLPDLRWNTAAWADEIFPGDFRMGSTQDEARYGDERPDFVCTQIGRPYRLSRHLVTVAQYDCFVREGGYDPGHSHWTESARQWLEDDDIRGPDDSNPTAFQTPNHPRIGVSWYEAHAFCEWLNERREVLGVPVGWRIRLPTEAEWERAARNADGRVFPWCPPERGLKENDWPEELTAHCNWNETGIGHTSAVGLFPSGKAVCGALDLAGNVWEWCRTKWRRNYEEYDSQADQSPDGKDSRVLRGGSWIDSGPDYLRAAFRDFHHPARRDDNIGFRVECVDESR